MSLSMRLTAGAFRCFKGTAPTEAELERGEKVHMKRRTEARPPWFMAKRTTTWSVEGRPVLRVTPPGGHRGVNLIYYHGGANVNPLLWIHWVMLERLQSLSGATLWVPSYPLAPEHSVEDALPFLDGVAALVGSSLPDGDRPGSAVASPGRERVVVGGDSSGGGLAVVHALRAKGTPDAPDGLMLFAPWVNPVTDHPASRTIEAVDPTLHLSWVSFTGHLWAGGLDAKDPNVAPLYGDLRGMPPMHVSVGDRDILLPDVQAFVARAREAGVSVEYIERPGAFHVYQGAIYTPESRADMASAARFIAGR